MVTASDHDGEQETRRPRGRRTQAGRRRPVWQRALLHGVLVVLSATFLVPLFWLIGSSLKTDDQIRAFPPEWLPDVPYYSRISPYIDAYHYGAIKRPEACPETTWQAIAPRLRTMASKPASSWVRVPPLPDAEAAALQRGTLAEVLAMISADTFARGADAVLAAAAGHVEQARQRAVEMSFRELGIGAVTFQGEIGEAQGLSQTFDVAQWEHVANPVEVHTKLLGGQMATVLHYAEPTKEGSCGIVQASIPWNETVAGFRNLTIKLHGDRSWRELELILRAPDTAYRLDCPILLSSASWTDLILIRDPHGEIPWGTHRLLKAKGEPGTGTDEARIEIEILGASHLTVVLRKLWHNYPSGLTFIPFARYLFNTLLICALVVIGVLVSCSLVAYGLARVRWQGRNGLFYIIIATMMLPFQVTMVPLFVVFARLGWVDTFLPLFVPAFFGNAFFIFLLRQFFLTVPPELTDAARVDGCSEFGIYWRVVLPLAKPALATVGLFAFMNTWNDYVGPLIYLSDTSKYTLSLGLATFSSQYGSYPGMLMAVTAVMTIPIIILFFITQRTFIQGITLTGIKG